MKLMRGDKIHSSLQFQGWRSWDLQKVQRLMWGKRSLLRDIIEVGSSDINVCARARGRTRRTCWCTQQVWISFRGSDFHIICLCYCRRMQSLPRCSFWIIHRNITDIDPGECENAQTPMADVKDTGVGLGVWWVWIITFRIFRERNVWISVWLASWQGADNSLPSSVTRINLRIIG